MSELRIAPVLALMAGIAGCAGSAGSPSPPPSGGGNPPPPPPPPPPGANGETGGGIWWGTMIDFNGDFINDAMCLIVETGELACSLSSPQQDDSDARSTIDNLVATLHGNVRISATSQSADGSAKIYHMTEQAPPDSGLFTVELTIVEGTLVDDNTALALKLTGPHPDVWFHGTYDPIYDLTLGDAVLWPADGVYTDFEIYGDPASLTIDADGTLFLQTVSGCSGNGQMINVDPGHVPGTDGYNAYTVDVTIDNCPGLNGAYEGLATLIDSSSVNGTDRLAIAVFNETMTIAGVAVK